MANLLIKHIPDEVLRNLKARARAHRRTLPEEVLDILRATSEIAAVDAAALAEKVRKALQIEPVGPPPVVSGEVPHGSQKKPPSPVTMHDEQTDVNIDKADRNSPAGRRKKR